MKISAGLVIIQDNKILLAHPTSAKWEGTYSIPKGLMEENESILDCALRETKEEIGIEVDINDITGTGKIIYEKKNKKYKTVHYFVVEPKVRIEIVDFNLQEEEVDWVGFLTKEEAEKRIFWRLKEVLNHLK